MRHALSSFMIYVHCCATELRQSSRRRGLKNPKVKGKLSTDWEIVFLVPCRA